MDCKAAVEGAPKAIKENVDKKASDDLKKKLEDAGAKVSVKPADKSHSRCNRLSAFNLGLTRQWKTSCSKKNARDGWIFPIRPDIISSIAV